MRTALIGYTGFVGSNIAAKYQFDDEYNTSNINEIDGQEYDLVVSAATYAEMWRINQNPEKDLAQINGLIDHLRNIKTKKFVLISTVGVYKNPNGSNEDTSIEIEGLSPYGVNRYHLEKFISDNFEALIIRLPGLLGDGLKKNAIYDLLHNNMTEKIHQASAYQYYNLGNIWKDIQIAITNHLSLVNFATEPVRNDEVATHCFGLDSFDQKPEGVALVFWDMHSKHATLFGGKNPYLYNKQQELDDIKAFVEHERSKIT